MTHSLERPAVLPEVLQQQARLDDPQAAARRDFIRWAPCKALLHHWRVLPCPPVPPLSAVQVLFKPASLAGWAELSFSAHWRLQPVEQSHLAGHFELSCTSPHTSTACPPTQAVTSHTPGCRRIKAMPAKLSEAELIRYRSSVYGVAATVGHVPRMHLGELTTCIPCFQAVLLCAPPWARAGKLTTPHILHVQCGQRSLHQPQDPLFSFQNC